MLISIFEKVRIPEIPETFTYNLGLVKELLKPYLAQFALWREVENNKDLLLTEAIMSFYLGDPIRCYNIINDEIDNGEVDGLCIMAQYYFAKSAAMILENHSSCFLFYAIPQAEKILADAGCSKIDRYYAAHTLSAAGLEQQALDEFKTLAELDFSPAKYAYASLLKNRCTTIAEYQQTILANLAIWYNMQVDYYRSPRNIQLCSGNTNPLEVIQPLIHVVENLQILNDLNDYLGYSHS